MDKSFQNNKSRNAKMDSIAPPDLSALEKLNNPKFNGNGVNRTAEEIFSGERFRKPGEFDRATKLYNDPTRKEEEKQEEEEDFLSDFETKSSIQAKEQAKEQSAMAKGVKVGGSYVKKRKIVVWIVGALVLLFLMMFFFPPIMSNDSSKSRIDYDRNVFENMGMTEFKTYALSNYSVYNEEAFSSERSENYRIIQLDITVKNPSPFEVKIPQFEVLKCDSKYENAICYATTTKTDKDNTIIGEIIPAFATQEVTVEVMINVNGMTDEQLDEAVSGIVLCTSGMKRKIAVNTYMPCIPGLLFVSDNIMISVNP